MIKVLIIDDEPLIAKMFAQALPSAEFQVTTVLHSDEALDVAQQHKPDIILLDIMMPEPNGMSVLDTLKAQEMTKAIPVIMLTNLSGKYDVETAKAHGALDYWVKNDIEVGSLGSRIQEVLKRIMQ